jgi:hypothetical protein
MEEVDTIDEGIKNPINDGESLPKVKVALILGIISIVAAAGGIPGIVLAIISKNMSKPGLAMYNSDPERYDKDKKTLYGARKCAKIGLIVAIPMTILVMGINILSMANQF